MKGWDGHIARCLFLPGRVAAPTLSLPWDMQLPYLDRNGCAPHRPHRPQIPASWYFQTTPANGWDPHPDSMVPRNVFVSSLPRPVSLTFAPRLRVKGPVSYPGMQTNDLALRHLFMYVMARRNICVLSYPMTLALYVPTLYGVTLRHLL